jgi:hypothetical protein
MESSSWRRVSAGRFSSGALVTDVEIFMAARFNGVRRGSVADARRVSKVRKIQFIPRLQRRWRNIGQRHKTEGWTGFRYTHVNVRKLLVEVVLCQTNDSYVTAPPSIC